MMYTLSKIGVRRSCKKPDRTLTNPAVRHIGVISLIVIPCKLIEHIVFHHLNISWDTTLHSFIKGLSCEAQLLGTSYHHDITRCVDKGHTTHVELKILQESYSPPANGKLVWGTGHKQTNITLDA